MADQLKQRIWDLEEQIEELSKPKSIEIITSVCDGLGENPVLKINGKIVKNFKHYHFDWDVYDCEETGYQGGRSDVTEAEAHGHHEELVGLDESKFPRMNYDCNRCKNKIDPSDEIYFPDDLGKAVCGYCIQDKEVNK
jgi:hypothetical protein